MARAAESALFRGLESLEVARRGGAERKHAEPKQKPHLGGADERGPADEKGDENDGRQPSANERDERERVNRYPHGVLPHQVPD